MARSSRKYHAATAGVEAFDAEIEALTKELKKRTRGTDHHFYKQEQIRNFKYARSLLKRLVP